MSKVAKLYISKAVRIYDSVPKIQKTAQEKADSFTKFADFRDCILGNIGIINGFKNISGDICQYIDSGNFDKASISSKLKKIKEVRELTKQVKTKINETKRFLTNEQIAGFEGLIEDCFNNLTFGTISKHNTKLESANKQLSKFIDQLKTIKTLANRVKTNIANTKRLANEHQNELTEFEKLIEDCDNKLTFDTINNYQTKLEDANKRLIEFTDQLKVVEDLISRVKTNITHIKRFSTNEQISDFENLIEDCLSNLTLSTIKTELENVNKQLLKQIRERIVKYQDCVFIQSTKYSDTNFDLRATGLKTDGTVISIGRNYYGRNGTESWRDIVAISSFNHTAGLKADGTVVAVGNNDKGQCNTANWRDIVTISVGSVHTVGLKADGTVVAVGNNDKGQCNTVSWRDIVAISAGSFHTVGLKADGTVVAVGDNDKGQCNTVSWRDIVAISVVWEETVGLKADGAVVAVGKNEDGQCNTGSWRDIVAISTGSVHTVGLKADGTVVAVGNNDKGQCNTASWRDIVAISTSYSHTVGLKTDGTVVAVGENDEGQCNTASWRDIVAISASRWYTVGLKKNGTVVVVGSNKNGQCIKYWKNIGPVPEEKGKGLCRYCGEKLSGLFSKKCNPCDDKRYLWEKQERIEKSNYWQNYWQKWGFCRYCGGWIAKNNDKCMECGKFKDY